MEQRSGITSRSNAVHPSPSNQRSSYLMRVFMSVRNNFGCLISYRMISDWVEGFLCAVERRSGITSGSNVVSHHDHDHYHYLYRCLYHYHFRAIGDGGTLLVALLHYLCEACFARICRNPDAVQQSRVYPALGWLCHPTCSRDSQCGRRDDQLEHART